MEFLPAEDAADPVDAPRADERGAPTVRRRLGIALVAALVAAGVIGWLVVRARGTDPSIAFGHHDHAWFAAMAPQRSAADRYERQVQCLGTSSRVLAAMPAAYQHAAGGSSSAARDAAARRVLEQLVNDGPGSRVYDTFAGVWAAHRDELLSGRAGALARLADLACVRLGG